MHCVRWRTGDRGKTQRPAVGLGKARRQRKKKASWWLDRRPFGITIGGAQRDVLRDSSHDEADLSAVHRQEGRKGYHSQVPQEPFSMGQERRSSQEKLSRKGWLSQALLLLQRKYPSLYSRTLLDGVEEGPVPIPSICAGLS